jgi:hypothetical protein
MTLPTPIRTPARPGCTHRLLVALAGFLLSTNLTAQPQALALTGHWLFVDDGTVIEFLPCGDAVCGRVRALPPKPDPSDPPPRCGQDVLIGFKPQASGWVGVVLDSASNKQYRASLQPAKAKGELDLVVKALGGLASETLRLAPAKEFKACP